MKERETDFDEIKLEIETKNDNSILPIHQIQLIENSWEKILPHSSKNAQKLIFLT